jgi:hypothetical protein
VYAYPELARRIPAVAALAAANFLPAFYFRDIKP